MTVIEQHEIELLQQALISAFPSYDALEMAFVSIWSPLELVAPRNSNSTLPLQVFAIIKEMRRLGPAFTTRVLRTARRANPGKELLTNFLATKLPQVIDQEQVNQLAALLTNVAPAEVRAQVVARLPKGWPLPDDKPLGAIELIELLADCERAAGQLHPLLACALALAYRAKGAPTAKLLLWCQDVSNLRAWPEEELTAYTAKLQEPPWRERTVRIFLSYASENRPQLDELQWLQPLAAQGLVDVCDPTTLSDQSEEEIRRYIVTTDLLLVFLSNEYFASKECASHLRSMQTRADGGRLVPIRLAPYRSTAFEHYRILPAGGRAVSEHESRAQAWKAVSEEIGATVRTHRRLLRPIKVTCSYHPADSQWMADLELGLAPLRSDGRIEWAAAPEALCSAEVILILVSADYIDSDAHYRGELEVALACSTQGQALVIPVLVRDTNWERTVLENFEPVPKGKIPLSHWTDRPAGIQRAVEAIDYILETVAKTPAGAMKPAPTIADRRSHGSSQEPLPMVIVSASKYLEAQQALRRHLGPLRQEGAITIIEYAAEATERPGTPGTPLLVLVLCCAKTAELPALRWIEQSLGDGITRIVPILLHDPNHVPESLSGLFALPSNEVAVANQRDPDKSWASVAAELAEVVFHLRGQLPTEQTQNPAPVVFDCYSGLDVVVHGKLKTHLTNFQRSGILRFPSSPRTGLGIREAMETAQLILLTVTENFLASDFCSRQIIVASARHRAGQALTVVVMPEPLELPEDLKGLPVFPAVRVNPDVPNPTDQNLLHLALELEQIIKIARLRPMPATK